MPNKTIYVADADVPLFDQAQALAGGNLSAAIAQAVRRYVATAQPASDEVIVQVNEGGVTSKKRFHGKLLAQQKVRTPDGARAVTYRVYQTEKGRFAVWSQSAPDWNRAEWWRGRRYEDWSGDWWQGESRLDVYETLDDLRDNIPPELSARVAAVVATGSDVEDLDI
ncbi:MAG TPA: EXLDI protein [Ktedonobacterales bacterium]|jgi:EXLDI family protein|nr:EXLDI protein [Ktedonobacterales bacterium]